MSVKGGEPLSAKKMQVFVVFILRLPISHLNINFSFNNFLLKITCEN